jgi:transcriptional regulator with XRE-family HTH domain
MAMARINFGDVLRKLRHSRDETLEQVSEATGLSVAMLSRIERGERLPSPDSVEALARHFEIPVDYLMNETIANRMVNRYGEQSSRSAAEHMSREPEALGLFGLESTAMADADVGAAQPVSEKRQTRRSYGVFKEMDILAALRTPDEAGAASALRRPAASAQPDMSAPLASEAQAGSLLPPDEQRPLIDPATRHVLIAARRSSEAATMLALREAGSLSREARVELIEQLAALADQTADVLRRLAKADPDQRVREAARRALDQLGRP